VPSQLGERLLSVSQARPQPPQFVVVFVAVSQPSTSGALVVQSAQPVAHPE
jgi:hypothetical protein